jgi:hypothetical protein
MQAEYGVQAVEEAAQFVEVLAVGSVGADVVEELAQPADLVGDFDVGSAHGAGGVSAAQEAVQGRVEELLFGLFVGLDLLGEHLVDAANLGQGLGRIEAIEAVGGGADPVDVGANGLMFGLEAPGQGGVLFVEV